MNKYLVELKNTASGEMLLVQVESETTGGASNHALGTNPGYEVVKVKGTHGGKRDGAGRVSKWGEDVITDRRRLPVKYSQQAEDIISELEMVDSILESWDAKVDESRSKSANGQPSERYKYVAQLISDLRSAMKVTGEKLV